MKDVIILLTICAQAVCVAFWFNRYMTTDPEDDYFDERGRSLMWAGFSGVSLLLGWVALLGVL